MPAAKMSKSIQVSLNHSTYPVMIGQDLLARPDTWAKLALEGDLYVVSDETVAGHYLDALETGLDGHRLLTHVVPPGERQKSIERWATIIDWLSSNGALRDSTLIALGGGVVADLTGFAAATYMRGIRVVQVPTTLLAQVDASVGGKTAVNHPDGKNLIGAFHQPVAVVVDTNTLATLPEREFRAGLAEVVKYGAIRDDDFFAWLEANSSTIGDRNQTRLTEMISRAIRHKAEIVSMDEKETGIRALLNFGHTFAHAIETVTAYSRYLHGEAVAIGMVAAARLSERRAVCDPGQAKRLEWLLNTLNLDTAWPAEVTPRDSLESMARDKKARQGGLRLVLLRAIGDAVVDSDSESHDIVRAIESMIRANVRQS